jgi:hypothetical protein
MLAVSENFELYVDGVKVVDLDRRHSSYEIFVYKDLTNNNIQVFYTPDYHKESDPDYANFEFKGSIIVPADSTMELEHKKSQLLIYLYAKVDQIYKTILSNYSVLEKESWEQQEAEARALMAVKTPLIDALCAVRGYSRDQLALKIIANADAAKAIGVSILAWQQGIEANIKNMNIDDFSGLWDIVSQKSL